MIATHALRPVEASGHATLVESVAAGRSSALFAVLAGVSLALMSGGPRPLSGPELRSVAAGLAVRAVLIGIVGLLLAGLGTLIAIILTYYAVLFVAGLPFLRLRARTLAVLAGVWIVAGPLLSRLIRPALAAQGLPEVNVASPRFVDLERPLNLLVVVVFTGWYPVFTWLAYLLLGLALGRCRLDRVRTAVVVLVSGAALALALGAAADPVLGAPFLVSARHIGDDLNRLSWFSTTPYLSALVADFRPRRLVVDPAGNYFWLSCATATEANANIAANADFHMTPTLPRLRVCYAEKSHLPPECGGMTSPPPSHQVCSLPALYVGWQGRQR